MKLWGYLPENVRQGLKPWLGLIIWSAVELVIIVSYGFDSMDWSIVSIVLAFQVGFGAWLDGL